MGQQQLLLLVLSTVIVGLATVAGIQAFSENQAQANRDALIQRANSLGAEILAAHNKPTQLGGIDLSSADSSAVKDAIGIQTDENEAIDAGGASNAWCIITTSSGTADVTCTSGDGQSATVNVDPSSSGDKVTLSSSSIGS